MEQYREGLNYIPLLSQNPITPPSSGRSRISLGKKRSPRSIIYFNGNYEGDSSMFRDRGFELERLSLLDTESDSELQKDATSSKEVEKYSLAWRLVQFVLLWCVNAQTREKMLIHLENFMETSLYNKILKWAQMLTIVFTYIFYFTSILGKRLVFLFHLFWKRRLIFHNLSRSLLWRLTLAKCNDLSLFVLILLSIPVLFILSLMGFLVSICGYIKDALYEWRNGPIKI